jgi:DNA-binding NarL/FixJ family response regulator
VADAIKVLLVDDHQVVRRGLRTFLEVQDDIEVVGEAADGAEGVERAEELKPDIVLMDVKMPGMDGIDALRKLRELNNPARVLIVTSFTEQRTVVPALRAGAAGYVYKDIDPEALAGAIRSVHAGHILLQPEVAGVLFTRDPLDGLRLPGGHHFVATGNTQDVREPEMHEHCVRVGSIERHTALQQPGLPAMLGARGHDTRPPPSAEPCI